MKRKITSVIFDADKTLWETNYRAMKLLIARKLNIHFSKEYFYQFDYLLKNIWSCLLIKQEVNLITEQTLIDVISTYINVANPNDFYNAFKECSKENIIATVKPNSLEVVKQLHSRNYKIYIKSNGITEVQRYRMREFGFSPYIELVLGCDNSFVKPDYRSITPITNNQDLSSFIIIGDKLKTDIALGNKLHIDTIWLNEDGNENSSNITPTYEISNIIEVLDYLPDLG